MQTTDPEIRLQVVVGVIGRSHNGSRHEYLIQQRPPGKVCAGQWEFPGGKIEQDEPPIAALSRELAEELGISVESCRFLKQINHDYSHADVSLKVYLVESYSEVPVGREEQILSWNTIPEIREMDVLEAVLPILDLLEPVNYEKVSGRAG